MIARYTRPGMGRIWSEENKFRQWLEVELAAAEAPAETGVVPREAARLLREHAACDAASPWFHYELTSNGVVDTAQALQLSEASELIERALEGLAGMLKSRAFEFQSIAVSAGPPRFNTCV